jgi:fatty-acid desaturase
MIWLITYCFAMYLLGGLGASLGYHRLLTHNSAEVSVWFKYSLVLLGLPAGTPVQWAGNHRAHHQHTDVKGDPHSPFLDGFWYAHCGWYIGTKNPILCFLYSVAGPLRMLIDSIMRPRTNHEHLDMAGDIAGDKFYATLSRPIVYMLILWFYLAVILLVPFLLFSWSGVIAASITLVIIYNLGDAVDSFGHLFGKRAGTSEARNNSVLGLLSFGDGWHANHHERPRRARHGLGRQFDLSYLFLRVFRALGIVKRIY